MGNPQRLRVLTTNAWILRMDTGKVVHLIHDSNNEIFPLLPDFLDSPPFRKTLLGDTGNKLWVREIDTKGIL